MLIHADKNVKESLFNVYKKDLQERQIRKEEGVNKEKIEDKNFVDQIIRLNEEEKQRKTLEKTRIKNENMYSYNELWKAKDEERKNRYYKVFDPKINYPVLNEDVRNLSKPILLPGRSYDFNSRINFDSQRDHLNNILNPDYLGVRNLESLQKNHKQEFQKIYKNFLDSQINTKTNIYDLNNIKEKEYHAMKRREAEIQVKKNPYSMKQYEIGDTFLNYNTITNPGPNLGYNKYLALGNNMNTGTPIIYSTQNKNINSESNSSPYEINGNQYSPDKNTQQGNSYGNYQANSYNNGYNNQMKERLQMIGNNIMK